VKTGVLNCGLCGIVELVNGVLVRHRTEAAAAAKRHAGPGHRLHIAAFKLNVGRSMDAKGLLCPSRVEAASDDGVPVCPAGNTNAAAAP
jgi:hypothetical protein